MQLTRAKAEKSQEYFGDSIALSKEEEKSSEAFDEKQRVQARQSDLDTDGKPESSKELLPATNQDNLATEKILMTKAKKQTKPAELPEELKNFDITKKHSGSDNDNENNQVATDESSSLTDGTTEESEIEVNEKTAKIHAHIRRVEGSDFYYKKFLPIMLALILTVAVVFLRGGSSMPSIIGAKRCNSKDWAVFGGYLVCIILVSLLCSSVVRREQKLKDSCDWNFSKFEKKFSNKFLMSGNIIGFVTGFLSANIGIGGGTVLIPVMMSFGFLPSVISYTTSYLVVNNKFVASLVFFLTEVVPLDYLLIVGGIMFISVFIMEFKSKAILKKLGR